MKRGLKSKIISLMLSACMILSLLPATAFAAVTDANDWPIFTMSEYNNPETQEVMLQQMLQNDSNFAASWGTIVKGIIKQQKNGDGIKLGSGILRYQDLSADSELIMKNSLSTAYNEAAGKLNSFINGLDSISKGDLAPTQTFLNSEGSKIAKIETEGPAFARYQTKTMSGSAFGNEFMGYYGAAGAITIQLFYDFKVEGLSGRFKTPDFEIGDDMAELSSKGITYALGGSSDSYTVKAENYNNFSNTVQKSYTYEKSTATSTEVSNSYTKDWSEETSIGVDIKLPFVNLVSAKVDQKVGYSYGISKTYSTSKSDTYTQSISDTIEVPLPPHTGIDIDVNIIDTTTSIPYTGAVRITYKTMVIYAAGISEHADGQGSRENKNGSFSFGNETYTAIQDLDRRIVNAGISGYDPDGLNLTATGNGLMANAGFAEAANKLRSGQPYSPYGGVFNYTSKGTTITPRKVVPIYPAARFSPDIEEITLYEQQTRRLDGIKLAALNEDDVPYYGFNARLDGAWTVVDEGGDENTDYAEITKDRNGYPLLKATAPSEDAKLYLRYQPDISKVALSDNYNSETILLKIKPVALSDVTLTGRFPDVILDDAANTVDVTDLKLTARDMDGQPFTPAPSAITWFTEEEGQGITVSQSAYEIKFDFDRAGTYQIYATVNETESNRIPLTVLPARLLEKITIEGEIPIMIWDDETKNTFDLNGINVSGKDQYGASHTVTGIWALGSDGIKDEEFRIARTQADTLTGLRAGSDMLWLRQNIGTTGSPSYIDSNPIPFTVRDASYPQTLHVSGVVPELYYNHADFKDFTLTNLSILCYDQYGEPYVLDPNEYIWELGKKDHASVENNVLTGLVVGTNQLTLSYPTKAKDDEGNPLGTISAAPLGVTVKALPYVNELYQGEAVPLIRETEAFALSNITLLARDQYGNPIAVPGDLQWSLADNNHTKAIIEDGKLIVTKGEVGHASWADVILEASSPSVNRTAKNVTVRVRQQPILTTLVATIGEEFAPKWQENAILSEYFTAAGFDQYGDPMPSDPVWNSSNPEAVSLESGILTFLQEDGTSVITAGVGDVVSNGITITVLGTPRVTSVTVEGAPASMGLNAQMALTVLTAKVFDQYKQQFDAEVLAAYPATIRWTLEKGATDAAISNGTVRFGGKTGIMTLICTVVNSDTNEGLVQKRLDIRVGPLVTGIVAASPKMSSFGGDNRITLMGENLQNGLRISAFDSTSTAVSGITAVTTGTATKQSATLKFPANTDTANAQTYTVRISYDDGVVYEVKPVATVTVDKKNSGGGGGGAGGGGGGGKGGDISSTPSYSAGLTGGVSDTLPVKFDANKGNATVDLGDLAKTIFAADKNTALTMPSIPGADFFTLDIPAGFLRDRVGGTALIFDTGAGGITLPGNMLSGVLGTADREAGITIAQGDKSGLTEALRQTLGHRPIIRLILTLDDAQTTWNNPNAPVTVSIPYTPTAAELANPGSIIIWDVDSSGNAVSVPNGSYDPKTGAVTFSTDHFGQYAVGYNKVRFADVADAAWYSGAVSFLAARGITSGTTESTYSPDTKLMRGQFVTLLLRAYGIKADENAKDNFSDAGDTYYTSYLAAAKRLGISKGVGGDMFAPGQAITRQEMFTLLYNALKVLNQLPDGTSGKTLSDFTDSGSIAPYAQEAMIYLVETGVIGGSNGKLEPAANTTRAEMAQVLYNLLAK